MSQLTIAEKKQIITKNGAKPERILNILVDLQFASEEGYIDQPTAALVAEELGMTETRVFEIVSYYAMLKNEPQAKYVLKVCNSAPCFANKSDQVIKVLEQELQVKIGEPTIDGMFAYHYIPCVGACDIGPIIKIKDTVFGQLNEEKIQQLLSDLRNDKIVL